MTHLFLSPQAEAGKRGGLTWSELGELTSLCTPPNGVDIPSLAILGALLGSLHGLTWRWGILTACVHSWQLM